MPKTLYFVAEDEDTAWQKFRRLLAFRDKGLALYAADHAKPRWKLRVFEMTLTDVTEPPK